MAAIGKVSITAPVRTVVVDPTFKPKPNVALSELTDTDIVNPETGEVLSWDSVAGKFVLKPLDQAQVQIDAINGGSF